MEKLPLTGDDLRRIADALDILDAAPQVAENPIIGAIDVIRPDGDDVVGRFVPHSDGWFGLETQDRT